MKYIDLSSYMKNDNPQDPPHQRPVITYTDHKGGVPGMLRTFPGMTEDDLPDGEAWSYERVTLSTHSGTHMDSPWHYHHTMDGGKPSLTIDQLSLEWCIADGVKLDFSDKPDGYRIMAADVEKKLEEIGYSIKENDIVFIQSGAGAWINDESFVKRGCGMSREATNFLTARGVHIVGTDGWSWDRPLSFEARDFRETHDTSLIWEGHWAGIDRGYFQIEKLSNLEELPPFGFKAVCIPIKIEKASAAWVRPIAIMED